MYQVTKQGETVNMVYINDGVFGTMRFTEPWTVIKRFDVSYIFFNYFDTSKRFENFPSTSYEYFTGSLHINLEINGLLV